MKYVENKNSSFINQTNVLITLNDTTHNATHYEWYHLTFKDTKCLNFCICLLETVQDFLIKLGIKPLILDGL
mgnify:CR=1 FL=1